VLALQASLGVGVALLNLVYWWIVVRRGQERFRVWCERRFDVTITLSYRGHWHATDAGPSRRRRYGIEWLHLAYFMGAFVVWGVAMTVAFLLLKLLD